VNTGQPESSSRPAKPVPSFERRFASSAANLARPRTWVPRAAGLACYVIGLLDVLSAVFPTIRRSPQLARVGHYLPGLQIDPVTTAGSLIIGILLILVAHGLRRRKHRAWMGTLVLLGGSLATRVVEAIRVGHGSLVPGGAILAAALLVLLLVHRREFYALSDPRSRWRAIWTFFALCIGDLVIGLLIVSARPQELVGKAGFMDRVEHVLLGLAGVGGPLIFRRDHYSDYVYGSLLTLGLITVVVTLYLFFRPAEPIGRMTAEQEAQVRELLVKQGKRDSLGYFALRRDKSVMFSQSGKSAIAYRVVSGVMLASGDPLGDPEAWPGAIKAFMDRALRYAWIPAVMGCSEQGGEVWCREADMDALELGDEAVVQVAEFSLDGRAMRNVRQMVNRIERQGYACEVRRLRDIPADQVALIRRLATAGRSTETERGFSMALGRFGDPADGECVVVTATKDGEIRAVLNFVPWGKDGLSLDLMRRDRTADPGLNELMIVAALREAKALGVARMSLNFAVFRSALERGEKIGAGPVLRRWRGLLVFLSRWFQIESLYRFNAKFRPSWEPRFVVYRQTRDLPRIAIAALEAEAFLVLPTYFRRNRKQAPGPASSLIVPKPAEPPAAEPPAAEPPAAEPPAAEQPPAKPLPAGRQPAQTPSAGRPRAEKPRAERPPVKTLPVEQPSAEQPPAEAAPAEQPPTDRPSAKQPSIQRPSTEQASTVQPSIEQPPAEQPLAETAAAEQPPTEQPLADTASAENPLAKTALVQQPRTGRPSAEQAPTEPPSAETPSAEQSPTDRPSAETPPTDQPPAETPPAE
jgi:lysyl-tRNA synthetase, class II